ncbi:MAG: hypothetical protein ACHQ53_16440 [Polyangiales bacterium]
MKICNRMAFAWLLGAMALGGAACSKSGSSTAITGAALTTNQIDDDSDNKVDESDEARCVCHDDATGPDGAATDDKDNHADEGAAKADGGAHRHHHCECADGGHADGDHLDGPGDHDGQHTQTTTTAPTIGK